jgi:hypothetical protein
MTVVINGTTGISTPGVTNSSTTTNTGNVTNSGTVTNASTISVGNATPSASGAGITFPATQSASTDANTLDDYEEGTFTPTWTGEGSNPTLTFNEQVGTYTKIGRAVYFAIRMTTASKSGGSGNLRVAGLPFTSLNSGARGMSFVNFSFNWASNIGRDGVIEANSTTLLMYNNVNGTDNVQTQVSDLGSNTYFSIGGLYFTN